MDNLVTSVAKAFWPKEVTEHSRDQVMRCATRMGIGARLLLQMSENRKPKFKHFWNKDSILYDVSRFCSYPGTSNASLINR